MGVNSDDERKEESVVAEAGEDVVDVTKGVLKAAADLVSKTGVVLLLIVIVGIVLLVIRDLIYQASAWSTTELVVIVAAWDSWSNCTRPWRSAADCSPIPQGHLHRLCLGQGPRTRNTARHTSALTAHRPRQKRLRSQSN